MPFIKIKDQTKSQTENRLTQLFDRKVNKMSIDVNISYYVSIDNNNFSFYIIYSYNEEELNKANLIEDLEDYSTKKLYLGLCEEFPEEKEELKEIQNDRDDLIDFIMNKIDDKMAEIK